MTQQIVIIGAGEAGARAAVSLRERGFGGSVTVVGYEPHAPYERPPLSKAVITSELYPDNPTVILDDQRRAELAVKLISGVRATSIDRATKMVLLGNGSKVGYSKLLLATGAVPRRLGVAGESHGNVLYLRTFSDALKLRDRLRPGIELVIIGGGFIGLEIAASAVARRCTVTLVEAGERLLRRGVPEVVADRIAAAHRAAGVEILTSVAVEAISARGERHEVRLNDGSVLTCNLIVAGVGAIPETRLAALSGLAVDNGISTDAFLQTIDPDIFSAGDCCSFPHPLYGGRRIRLEAWRNAQDQGAVAAANVLGAKTAYIAVPWFWSDQYDETLQVAGLFDESCSTVERRLDKGASVYFHLDPKGRLMSASAVGANDLIAKDIRVAEMLIARQASPSVADLRNPLFKLKGLLKDEAPAQ